MATNSAIDLSTLPAPAVVEVLDFEAIFAEMLADLRARDTTFSALVESDPAYKILEVAAYREVIIRQRINDAAKAVMLPYAIGADLDNLAAFYKVTRLTIDEGDPDAIPPVDPIYESDTSLRRRTQLALEGFSTAGPKAGYEFHARKAAQLKDVSILGPEDSEGDLLIAPGTVLVTVLSLTGNGEADGALIADVEGFLNDEDVRPLTDYVQVQGAEIIEYAIEATIYTYAGPDAQVIMDNAQSAITVYIDAHHSLGYDISISGIYAALHQPGVQRVELAAPMATISILPTQAGYCTGVTLTHGGYDA
jgi:phage-related baseplate assembly protein